MSVAPGTLLRMPKLGPAERVGLGLTSIVVSCVLVLDFAFGIFPDRVNEDRLERARVSEQLALQAVALMEAAGPVALGRAMREWVVRDEQILSVAVRAEDQRIVAQSGGHENYWEAPDNSSSLKNIEIALNEGTQHWGTFEISFTPIGPTSIWQWLIQPWLILTVTLGFGGFILFSLYLRRVFEYLDPQSVVPDRIRAAFDAFGEGVMVIDNAGRVILANSAIRKWLNEDRVSITGRPARKINALNAALPARTSEHPWMRAMKQRTSIRGEYIEIEQPGGDLRKLTVNCSPVLDPEGGVRGCIATFGDITEIESLNRQLLIALEELESARAETEARNKALRNMAMHDVLTGGLNRRAFFEAIEPMFHTARHAGQHLTCIMIDIDHFKSFNDRFGHDVGDHVLKVTAQILHGGVRSDDVLCRYGGEEFCMFMPRAGTDEAARVAERLRAAIESAAGKGIRGAKDVHVTASFGIAEFKQHETAEDLIKDADRALYAAKEEGRNRVKLFDPITDAETA